jgi:hypothetical protein
VRATLLAAVLTVLDLAGNSIKTRTTALFAPVGYGPAVITVRDVTGCLQELVCRL